jgi:hypothetical protein
MGKTAIYPIQVAAKPSARCLSCGTGLPDRRRRYCSVPCRQRLHYKLDVRTGLLRALNARYATFSFSNPMVVMDVVPYGVNEIYSYIYPRQPATPPADDFSRMADLLAHRWWKAQHRSKKRYLATRQILELADRKARGSDTLRPLEFLNPSVNQRSLVQLRLDRNALQSDQAIAQIKQAYRSQAKRFHPDVGGDNQRFRKIHQAYLELIEWVENPRFFRRRGFPDKWFYSGSTNRWAQPTPVPKTSTG